MYKPITTPTTNYKLVQFEHVGCEHSLSDTVGGSKHPLVRDEHARTVEDLLRSTQQSRQERPVARTRLRTSYDPRYLLFLIRLMSHATHC